ncbi:C2 domain-containing protein [Psidium guajava]|nr:C2 domain-containing protein [Psidium guajava]
MAPPISTSRLLELNLISAQDLAPVSKSMRTYAVAWVHPDRKLTTRVDEKGHANPNWDDKFVFRVDDVSLETDTCVITIEIYALTWLRVVLVGTVRALLSSLIPPSSRTRTKNTPMRFMTLQVLRPSGRPQGAINFGVSLINSSMRSMPLNSELSGSLAFYGGEQADQRDYKQPGNYGNKNPSQKHHTKIHLWRSQSERTNDYSYNPGSTVCNDSMVGFKQTKGGSLLGSIISDVGPSASIVAAAIAKGLLHPNKNNRDDAESSVLLDNWTEKDSIEGLRTKIERWRTELPPVHDRPNNGKKTAKSGGNHGKDRPRRHSDGGGLFSCFGNAYGCEFSISCGGGNAKKIRYGGG